MKTIIKEACIPLTILAAMLLFVTGMFIPGTVFAATGIYMEVKQSSAEEAECDLTNGSYTGVERRKSK